MTSIAYLPRLLEGNRHRFGRCFRKWQTTRGQYLLDQWNQPPEHIGAPERITAASAHLGHRITNWTPVQRLALLGRSRDTKSFRHHGFEFQDVGNVIDETLRLAAVQEANRRGVGAL
jgi:hypothetical protein